MKKRLVVLFSVLTAVIAVLATSVTTALAAPTAPPYCLSLLDQQNGDAVLASVTHTVPFNAGYPGPPAGFAPVNQNAVNFVLTAEHFPGVFYVGLVPSLNSPRIAADFTGIGTDTPEATFAGGFAKYRLTAGACSSTPPVIVPARNGVAYCASAPVARFSGGLGTFLDLVAGQTMAGVTLTPAIYLQGYGLMCQVSDVFTYGGNPGSFRLVPGTFAGSGGDLNKVGGYPYYTKI